MRCEVLSNLPSLPGTLCHTLLTKYELLYRRCIKTQQTNSIDENKSIHHTSHVTRQTSHVKRRTSHITHHTPHVTRHTSHVTHNTSHITRHLSLSKIFQCTASGIKTPIPHSFKRKQNRFSVIMREQQYGLCCCAGVEYLRKLQARIL